MPVASPDEALQLTDLQVGARARLLTVQDGEGPIDSHELEMLAALGLAPESSFELCRIGNPCIVQVGATRIGIAEAVAQHLLVAVED